MKSLRRFLSRLGHFVTRRRDDERLREEIAEHIALQTAENLRAGLSPVEARRQAMLKFGGVEAVKEDYRAERGLVFIENLLGDLRNAGRTIRRMPGLAAVIVVSLAIGIGVNTTIFSWIQMILFQPMPSVSGAASFLLVELRTETGGYPGASWPEYRALRTQVPALQDIVASQMVPFNVGKTGQTERTHGQLVSGNYFSALGLKPAIGRFIRPEEAERPGTEPVVVISYDYWQTRFGGAPGAVGQKLRVNERELIVIGVAPKDFQGTMLPLKFELWAPATMAPALLGGARDLEDRSSRGYSLIGMLRPGEHGKPHAGSWKHPAARDGRARRAGRGALADCQPGALGKYAARFPGNNPRSSHRRLGHHCIARRAHDWRISNPVSDKSG